MSPDDYVGAVVARYALPDGPDSPASRAITGLTELVKPWAGQYLMATGATGSFAKGTRIRGSTDLDIVIELGPRTRGTPEQVHKSLFSFLKHRGLSPRSRNVCITFQYQGLLVDIIPARQEWGSAGRVALFETERNQVTVTNLEEHVRLIRESGRIDDIKALKIWRDFRGLRFPSFYLELVVLDALRHRARNQPGANLLGTLEYLRDRFVSTPFRDPANFDNRVSTELTEHEQIALATAARESLRESNWERIVR